MTNKHQAPRSKLITTCRNVPTMRCAESSDSDSSHSSNGDVMYFREHTPDDFDRVFRSACTAGTKAAAEVAPPLLIVTDPGRMRQAQRDEDVQGLWIDPGGPVGMASIIVQPATYRFSRWLLKQGLARRVVGRRGITVRAACESQSSHKAAAYAMDFVRVIERAKFGVRVEIVLRYD